MATKKNQLPEGVSVSVTAIEGPGEPARHTVSVNPAVIGSAGAADISLPGGGVTQSHARLTLNEAGYFLEDLGSGGVTKVNDLSAKRIKLRNGDIIEVGQYKLLLQLELPSVLPKIEVQAAGAPAAKRVWLVGFSEEIRNWFTNTVGPKRGVETRAFKGGEEALVAMSEALAEDRAPDALLLDLKIPIINGLNVAISTRGFELGFNRQERVDIIFLFNPPESTNFDKVVEFLKPATLVPPGDTDGFLQHRINDLIKKMA